MLEFRYLNESLKNKKMLDKTLMAVFYNSVYDFKLIFHENWFLIMIYRLFFLKYFLIIVQKYK